jgi:hypothetical protein
LLKCPSLPSDKPAVSIQWLVHLHAQDNTTHELKLSLQSLDIVYYLRSWLLLSTKLLAISNSKQGTPSNGPLQLPLFTQHITLSSISMFVPMAVEEHIPFSQQEGIFASFPYTQITGALEGSGQYSLSLLTKGIDIYAKSINGNARLHI